MKPWFTVDPDSRQVFPLPKYRGKSGFNCIIPLNVYELWNYGQNLSGGLGPP